MCPFLLVYFLTLLVVATLVAVCDFKYRSVPNRMILTLGGLGILKMILFNQFLRQDGVMVLVAGMLLGFCIFYIPALLTNKIGYGDVKLSAVIGLNAGVYGITEIIVIMGMIIVLYLVIAFIKNKTVFVRRTIPLAPFLMLGMLVWFVWEYRVYLPH